jgi:hypothetical protein
MIMNNKEEEITFVITKNHIKKIKILIVTVFLLGVLSLIAARVFFFSALQCLLYGFNYTLPWAVKVVFIITGPAGIAIMAILSALLLFKVLSTLNALAANDLQKALETGFAIFIIECLIVFSLLGILFISPMFLLRSLMGLS